jgi:2,6-dihydroxypyridine 3-monooxygenase
VAEESHLSRETFVALHEGITYHLLSNSHILAYSIPNADGTLRPGARRINWVWYRNVPDGPALDSLMTDRHGVRQAVSLPPGAVRGTHVEALRQAAARLPRPLRELVGATAEPFIQVVVDVEVPRMRFGRVCLIGDAAFALRPHAAAGTAKAAEDAWRLAQAIAGASGDVLEGAGRWEPNQLALGRSVLARARRAGIRSQFEGTWRTGDPLPFGLYRVSDSAIVDVDSEPAR